jgi:hypothetical protein
MADKKISALTGATTPLAGTEVLPIVQGGATVKVAVSDLTAGRAISATSVTATTGNFVVGTSGQGIDFSATPSTGTSELLADYEEGTWTPTVSGFGSPTYITQNGNYTKVGNLVHITGKLHFSGASGASAISIDGLPFASGQPNDAFQRASCFVEGDWAGALTFIASYGMFRTNGSSLQGVKNSAGSSALAVASDFSATASFNFSLTYYV